MKAILKWVVAMWILSAGVQGTAVAVAHSGAAGVAPNNQMMSDWDCSRICD